MFTFLHKEVQVVTEGRNLVLIVQKRIFFEFSVPHFRREQMVSQLSSLLEGLNSFPNRLIWP